MWMGFFILSSISGSAKNTSCAQQIREEERYNCNVFHWVSLVSFVEETEASSDNDAKPS